MIDAPPGGRNTAACTIDLFVAIDLWPPVFDNACGLLSNRSKPRR
jgi:hypothetical protein